MEQQTSKLGINILIIVSILLIGTSLVVTYNKKPAEEAPAKVQASPEITKPVEVVTQAETSTTTDQIIQTEATTTTSTTTLLLTNKSWTWTKAVTSGTKDLLPKKPKAFTITLAATGTLSGTTDCNNFFGTYKADVSNLSFGALGSTRMFCEGSQETEFLMLLEKSKSYIIDSNHNLIITTSSSTLFFK